MLIPLYSLQKLLPKAQWKSLYGTKTLNDLIDENVEEARNWGGQSNSYFVAFPALKQMSKARIFESLVSDTFIWIFQYVLEHYDGSIINYFTPILDDLIGVPLFSPGKSKLSVSLNEDKVSDIPNISIENDFVTEFLDKLEKQFLTAEKYSGIAFTIPLKSITMESMEKLVKENKKHGTRK